MKNKKELTIKELQTIKGGTSLSNQDDIVNLNRVNGCICNYLNASAVKNNNQTTDCRCNCQPKPIN